MFKRLASSALVFGLLAAAPPALSPAMAQAEAAPAQAQAQTQVKTRAAPAVCAPRERIVERLEKRHSETRQARGLAGTAALLEVWASPDSGSWTVLMTRPDGVACVVASGDHWLDERTLLIAGDPA